MSVWFAVLPASFKSQFPRFHVKPASVNLDTVISATCDSSSFKPHHAPPCPTGGQGVQNKNIIRQWKLSTQNHGCFFSLSQLWPLFAALPQDAFPPCPIRQVTEGHLCGSWGPQPWEISSVVAATRPPLQRRMAGLRPSSTTYRVIVENCCSPLCQQTSSNPQMITNWNKFM